MPTGKASGRYRFSIFEVNAASGELFRQGVRIKLQEQPFRLLVLLLERAGEVVSREELRGQLWPQDTFVAFDNSLNVAVRKLRDALRDDADSPRFVETLPRRGFRFMAPVTSLADQPGPQSPVHTAASEASAESSLTASEVGIVRSPAPVPGARRPAIVVLPFANLSPDADSEFFADGVTEEIINALAQIEDLRVVARTSAFSFKGKQVDLRTVGASLNVSSVLEGSIRKSGSRVRIVAQLIDAADGYHIWSERYDRELQDIFEVQDEIARTIADKLKVTLGVGRREPLVKAGTTNLEAYQLYLNGRFHLNKRSADGLRKAIEYFQQAIATDPNYALAYSGLAEVFNMMAFRNVLPPHAIIPKAKAAAARALDLDPRRAEPYISLGYAAFTYDRDWPAAGRFFEQGLGANPACVLEHPFYPLYLCALGRPEESLRAARHALERDPASPVVSHMLAVQLYLARLFEAAVQQCHRTLEMDSNYGPAMEVLGQVYSLTGLHKDAVIQLQGSLAASQRSPWALALIGFAHARAGERNLAQDVVAELTATSKTAFVPASCFALVYTGLCESDQAFSALETAAVERNSRLAYLRIEALWDPLRSDPRFPPLLQRTGFPAQIPSIASDRPSRHTNC